MYGGYPDGFHEKFIGTARGCGSLRGKCDQVGASELWELVDLVVHDGRGEWHRNGECCCLLSNTTLLCSVARKPRVNKQTCTLLIPTTLCLTRQQCVWEKCLIRRLHRPPVGISASPARKLVHCFSTIYKLLKHQVKEENSIQTRSVQNKRALVTIVWNFRGQRILLLLNEIFGSHIQEVCMTNCDVRFPSLAIRGALRCRPPLAYLQRNCGCGIFHCVHFSAWFLVSMQLKDFILRLQKRTDTL